MSLPLPAAGPRSAMLFDATLCVGCGACSLACKERNGLPKTADDPLADTLSSKTFSVVNRHGKAFARHMCMHCADPTCASVCLVGAFKKTALGPVAYDEPRCIGCRYCMQACPFMVPRYEWESTFPRVRKCDMCLPRQEKGLAPACASVCPTGATRFGKRDALLADAHKRIADSPGRYVEHVYGEHEVGGTDVLLLSPVPFDEIGYPVNLPQGSVPNLSWQVMSQIPKFAFTASVFLAGVWWITSRREDVAAHEGGHGAAPNAGSSPKPTHDGGNPSTTEDAK